MQLRLYVYTRARAASVNDVTRLFESLFFFLFFNWNVIGLVSIRDFEIQVKFFR